MSGTLRQDSRVNILNTPLGKDKLALSRFDGSEGLSELFEYRVEAVSEDKSIDFDQLLGLSSTVTMKLLSSTDRHFDGLVAECQTMGKRDNLYVFGLILRPRLWLLSHTTNCRIWHDKTAIEVVKAVLSDRGVEFRDATSRACPKLDYCVQYRETDLAFVSRLLEQNGVYYFFEHASGSHTMVLADSISGHQPMAGTSSKGGAGTVRYIDVTSGEYIREQALYQWSAERRHRSGKVKLRDYNFKEPSADMKGQAEASENYAHSKMELYDYPGKFDKPKDGRTYADTRLEAEQAMDRRRYGSGEAPSICPGTLVTLIDHPLSGENFKYLAVRATHHFSSEAYRSSSYASTERPYEGQYEFHRSDRAYRAPLSTPKPVVHGPHTARVVGRPGGGSKEIDVDDDGHGRIRVRFHWDQDDKRSCWVRVAQTWAGKSWGGQFIPRVGMEVVVEFLEGDPDQPIVVGALYNGENKYPYPLPDNKTQSGVKSNSSKGGMGYNEFMFEDKKDSEKIRMHAEKDHEVVVLNTETWEIGENFSGKDPSRTTTLKNGSDELTIEAGNQTITIHGTQSITADRDISITSLTSITLTVGASTVTLKPDRIELTSGSIVMTAPRIDMN